MNLFEKLDDSRFLEDMGPLLTNTTSWNPKAAGIYVLEVLSSLMPGEAWKQTEEKLKDLITPAIKTTKLSHIGLSDD
nr:hypothetical protein [Prosthecochloris sp. ZM_2]